MGRCLRMKLKSYYYCRVLALSENPVAIYSIAHMLKAVYIWHEPQHVQFSGRGFQTSRQQGSLWAVSAA